MSKLTRAFACRMGEKPGCCHYKCVSFFAGDLITVGCWLHEQHRSGSYAGLLGSMAPANGVGQAADRPPAPSLAAAPWFHGKIRKKICRLPYDLSLF